MMSASAISAEIRAKKKSMEEEDGMVKLSGIPEDATDIMVNENHIEGEKLSENHPSEESEAAEGMEPESELNEESKARHMKIKAMMGRMGK